MTSTPHVLEPAVFGFALRSDIELKFLRHGGGREPLDIVESDEREGAQRGELLGEWPLHGTSYPAHARLSAVPGGFEYFTSDAGLFRVDVDAASRVANSSFV